MASSWRRSERTQGWDDRLRVEDLADEPAFELEPDRWPRVADIAERPTAACCDDGEAAGCDARRTRSAASRERGAHASAADDSGVELPGSADVCPGWSFGVEEVTDAVVEGWAADEGDTLLDWGRVPESWEDEGAGVPSGSDREDAGTGFLWGDREGCLDDYVWILVQVGEGEYSFMILGRTEMIVPADSYAGHRVYTAISIQRRTGVLETSPNMDDRPRLRVTHWLSFDRYRHGAGLVYAGQATVGLRVAGHFGGAFDYETDYVTTRLRYRIWGALSGIDGSGVGRDTFGETTGCAEYAEIVRMALSQGLRAVAQTPEVEELETHLAYEGSPEVGLPRAVYLLARSNEFLREVGDWFFAECVAL